MGVVSPDRGIVSTNRECVSPISEGGCESQYGNREHHRKDRDPHKSRGRGDFEAKVNSPVTD